MIMVLRKGASMLILSLILGCTKDESKQVVIYSGRKESLVDELFQQAAKDLELDLQVQYGKSAEMVSRMLLEGQQSPADLIFTQEIGRLEALSDKDMLNPLSDSLYEGIISEYADDKRKWIGTSGRLRVLVYDSNKIPPEELPKTLEELADPKWNGKLGWAPTNGSFEAHVSALRHLWGEEKTKNWLKAVRANNPQKHPKNSPQVKAVMEGNLQIGWVNHYYLHKSDKEGKSAAKNHTFPSAKDGGNVMMVAGMAVRKGSENQENAEKVIKYFLDEGQKYFMDKTYEYPTREGLSPNPSVTVIDPGMLAPISQSHLSDIAPTDEMLKELGLR